MSSSIEPRAAFFRPWLGWLAALAIAGVGVGLEWRRAPAIFTPSGVLFVDPDDFMRLVRVRSILEGGPRIIRHDSQVNWPHGVDPHWTAPMDYLLVAANSLFGGLSQTSDRLAGTAAWVPVWLGMAYSLVMMAMIRRACGWGPALLAGCMIVFSPAYHRVFQLGHPDHHCLLELLFAVSVAAWVPRLGINGEQRVPSHAAVVMGGIAIGLAIWVAAQALAVWAAILAGATFASFHASPEDRPIWAARRRQWSLAVLGVVFCGHVVENAGQIGAAAVDKIGLFHVALAVLALLVPTGSGKAPRDETKDLVRRWGPFALVAVAFVAWVALDRARIFRYSQRDELRRWWEVVAELLPLYTHAGGQWSLFPLHVHLGYAVYALPLTLVFFVRSKALPCGAKLTLALLALGMTALAIYQRRWLDHVNIGLISVTVIGIWEFAGAILTARKVDRNARANGGRSPPYVRLAVAAVLLGMVSFPYAWAVMTQEIPSPRAEAVRTAYLADRINAYESAHAPDVAPGRAILCDEGAGPMLLYRTRLPVVAAPYHRAIDGIVAAARFYAERDPIEARRMLDELGVKYVVVPFRPHEQLINFERVAFGELRSYDPPEQSVDAEGNIQERLNFRPGFNQTAIYRLTLQGGGGIPGLELVESIKEGATTPDGKSGLLYVVRDN
ncbi:MAG TPA: hypothetical protein VJZ71_07990 [Phycisphaerae bacterium]|nr:hypothetical protein [Phycisphaerae bacterium]